MKHHRLETLRSQTWTLNIKVRRNWVSQKQQRWRAMDNDWVHTRISGGLFTFHPCKQAALHMKARENIWIRYISVHGCRANGPTVLSFITGNAFKLYMVEYEGGVHNLSNIIFTPFFSPLTSVPAPPQHPPLSLLQQLLLVPITQHLLWISSIPTSSYRPWTVTMTIYDRKDGELTRQTRSPSESPSLSSWRSSRSPSRRRNRDLEWIT